MILNVPYVNNPDQRCVPASIGMVLGYFLPEKPFTMAALEKLTGYVHGKATWPTKSMLELSKLGFELRWIENYDLLAFSRDPEAYLRSILTDPAALEYQIRLSDLPAEAALAKEYFDKGLPFEHRHATREDITSMLDSGWLVRLGLEAGTLAGKDGYEGHSVVVIGYDDSGVTIHNPDGTHGNRPHQYVTWELLEEAGRKFAGGYSLFGFRLSSIKRGVVAGAVVRRPDGKYLMVQERQPRAYGLWNIPAGHADPGETPAQAAVREAKEESGYDIELQGEINAYHYPKDSKSRHAFRARIIGGELKVRRSEILDAQWFSFTEIQELGRQSKIRSPWILDAISQVEHTPQSQS